MIFSVKMRVVESGEWARERSEIAILSFGASFGAIVLTRSETCEAEMF